MLDSIFVKYLTVYVIFLKYSIFHKAPHMNNLDKRILSWSSYSEKKKVGTTVACYSKLVQIIIVNPLNRLIWTHSKNAHIYLPWSLHTLFSLRFHKLSKLDLLFHYFYIYWQKKRWMPIFGIAVKDASACVTGADMFYILTCWLTYILLNSIFLKGEHCHICTQNNFTSILDIGLQLDVNSS